MAYRTSVYSIAVIISLALISIELTSTTLSKTDKKTPKPRTKTTSRGLSEKWEGPINHNVYEKGMGSFISYWAVTSKQG